MDRAALVAIAVEPRLVRGEGEDRREPESHAAENLLDRRQRGLARHARRRIAVERVLADVEIERRQIGGHELRQRRDHALVVVGRIGVAHGPVELREPVQHQPLQLGHIVKGNRCRSVVMRERPQHPADGVAQLAVGLDEGVDDLLADAQIVGIVRRRDPQPQDVGAGLFDHVLRRDHVAERLAHLLAVRIEHEAVRQHHVEGRASARAAAFEQRGMKPAAMLVRSLQIHHRVGAAVDPALDSGEAGKMRRVFEREGVRRS